MKPSAKHRFSLKSGETILISMIVAVLVIFVWISNHSASKTSPLTAPVQPVASRINLLTPVFVTNQAAPPATSRVLATRPDFQGRPFPVAQESSKNQWTQADGRDTNVIYQLAHNILEYNRMVEENSRIFRRQLVYLKETTASVFEAAKLTGKPVQQLTLPGFDGHELQFDIVKSDSNGSSRRGTFNGHLAGNVNSLVTLAFQDGREAYTILSPKDNIFVVAEPREPGQVIIKAINPDTYGVGPEETPDAAKPDSTKQ